MTIPIFDIFFLPPGPIGTCQSVDGLFSTNNLIPDHGMMSQVLPVHYLNIV